jgi:lysyl-tRNA synthetase, class II
MNEFPLHSSVLSAFRYDPDHEDLWLRFRTGDLYLYRTVPATVAKALLEARSHGEYFNKAIRGRFPFLRLS